MRSLRTTQTGHIDHQRHFPLILLQLHLLAIDVAGLHAVQAAQGHLGRYTLRGACMPPNVHTNKLREQAVAECFQFLNEAIPVVSKTHQTPSS